jgi:hypothetical protein
MGRDELMTLAQYSAKMANELSLQLPMADSKALRKLQRKHRSLVKKIGQIGPVLKGSVTASYTRCGKSNCRCQDDPPQLHGPYWRWSTSVDGKRPSVTQ